MLSGRPGVKTGVMPASPSVHHRLHQRDGGPDAAQLSNNAVQALTVSMKGIEVTDEILRPDAIQVTT